MEVVKALRELGRTVEALDIEIERAAITIDGGLAILSQSEVILKRIDESQLKLVDLVEKYKGKVTLVPDLVKELEQK